MNEQDKSAWAEDLRSKYGIAEPETDLTPAEELEAELTETGYFD